MFNSSAVNIFSCADYYIVNLISVEVYLLQVLSGKAAVLYAYLKAVEITFTPPSNTISWKFYIHTFVGSDFCSEGGRFETLPRVAHALVKIFFAFTRSLT